MALVLVDERTLPEIDALIRTILVPNVVWLIGRGWPGILAKIVLDMLTAHGKTHFVVRRVC